MTLLGIYPSIDFINLSLDVLGHRNTLVLQSFGVQEYVPLGKQSIDSFEVLLSLLLSLLGCLGCDEIGFDEIQLFQYSHHLGIQTVSYKLDIIGVSVRRSVSSGFVSAVRAFPGVVVRPLLAIARPGRKSVAVIDTWKGVRRMPQCSSDSLYLVSKTNSLDGV